MEFAEGFYELGLAQKRPRLGTAMGCAFSPDASHAVVGWDSGTVVTWTFSSEKAQGLRIENSPRLGSCAYSPDGRFIATAFGDGQLRLWDPLIGTSYGQIKAHELPVACCALPPDGRYVATGSFDCTVKLWSTTGLQPAGPTLSFPTRVNACEFSPDGRYVVAGDGWGSQFMTTAEGRLSVWDPWSAKGICNFPYAQLVTGVAVLSPRLELAATSIW